jgi:hypothetical protein
LPDVPPPALETLVTSVQITSPFGLVKWTFDHAVESDGEHDPAFKIAGFGPAVVNATGADWVEFDYFLPLNPGLEWTIDATPTHVTSPGREIVVPQSGVTV